MRHVRFFFLLVFFPLFLGVFAGQAVIPMSSPVPKDPAAMLALAAAQNGLEAPDLKPWHLRATYQTFDEAGQTKDSGVFEEWWAGPKKYKRSYSSKNQIKTIYVTESGTYTTEPDQGSSMAEWLLTPRLLTPIPALDKEAVLIRRTLNFGSTQLDCVVVARKMPGLGSASSALFPTYCFEPGKPMLRWSGSYGERDSFYNHIVLFQERYVAQDVNITEDNNRPVLAAHVESVSLLTDIKDDEFTPPADAVRADSSDPVKIDSQALQKGKRIKVSVPVYPSSAKQAHIQGDVTLQVEIGEDGHVHEMRVLSAPDPSIAVSAMLAVHQWQYQPFLINGKPVRVQTQIN